MKKWNNVFEKDTNMFEIKKFNSGEYDIKLIERVTYPIVIKWNWFKEKDILIPLMQLAAIKTTYNYDVRIRLQCNYMPYSRQDRVFIAGQSNYAQTVLNLLNDNFDIIETMALHCKSLTNMESVRNLTKELWKFDTNYITHVFPDENAQKHFYNHNDIKKIIFAKTRDDKGHPALMSKHIDGGIEATRRFIICDDICDGGRTFVACANKLREMYGDDIKIELMIYHAFMTHGLDDLKASGISQIAIINPDSYDYVIEQYPNDVEYFRRESI